MEKTILAFSVGLAVGLFAGILIWNGVAKIMIVSSWQANRINDLLVGSLLIDLAVVACSYFVGVMNGKFK